jgi:hypothetical protein
MLDPRSLDQLGGVKDVMLANVLAGQANHHGCVVSWILAFARMTNGG